MHTTPQRGLLQRSRRPVSDSVLIPIAPGINLPVWAIFLCIYPPLSLVFILLTYLAFRWRWWRSGGSVS